MASSIGWVAPQKAMEDPLAFLSCSIIAEYKKGRLIYDQDSGYGILYFLTIHSNFPPEGIYDGPKLEFPALIIDSKS